MVVAAPRTLPCISGSCVAARADSVGPLDRGRASRSTRRHGTGRGPADGRQLLLQVVQEQLTSITPPSSRGRAPPPRELPRNASPDAGCPDTIDIPAPDAAVRRGWRLQRPPSAAASPGLAGATAGGPGVPSRTCRPGGPSPSRPCPAGLVKRSSIHDSSAVSSRTATVSPMGTVSGRWETVDACRRRGPRWWCRRAREGACLAPP